MLMKNNAREDVISSSCSRHAARRSRLIIDPDSVEWDFISIGLSTISCLGPGRDPRNLSGRSELPRYANVLISLYFGSEPATLNLSLCVPFCFNVQLKHASMAMQRERSSEPERLSGPSPHMRHRNSHALCWPSVLPI